MTLRTAKLLWLFLGLTPIAETLTSGADKTAIAGGVIYVLGALALHRAERRDPSGEVLRTFAGTRIALVSALGGILVLQLVAGLVSGRVVLVVVMGLGLGLFVLWARSRTGRELTGRVGGLLLLSAALTLIGAFGEVSMIILEPYLFKGFYEYDPDLGFRVRAHQPTEGGLTNKYGFNDRDYPEQKTEGVFRVLVVGDSFSWAGGREGNYTALLERKLEDHYGYHKIDVINAGYPMTHTAQQLAMLKKYGLRYNPDMVLLGFFVGNDFIDAKPDRKRIVVNGIYVNIDPSDEWRFLGYPIIPQSRLFLFLKQKCRIIAEFRKAAAESQGLRQRPGIEPISRPGGAAPPKESRASVSPQAPSVPGDGLAGRVVGRGPRRPDAPCDHVSVPDRDRGQGRDLPQERKGFMSEKTFLALERAKLEFFNIGPSRNERFQRNVNYILRSIDEMDALLKLRNAKLIVAIYPDEFQVDKTLFKKIVDKFKLPEGDYDPRLGQKILKRFLESKYIHYIDMTERFVSEGERADLYLLRDTHWNSAGNQLAADILFENLANYAEFR
jgi:SGNH hydrolase-like domain, acetyltransferase AlgX